MAAVAGRSTGSLEGIETMTDEAAWKLVAVAQLLMGIFLIGVGIFVFLPVAVNLPDSWTGALLSIFLFGVGGSVVWAAARNLRAAEPK
jgi:hypothetical protein